MVYVLDGNGHAFPSLCRASVPLPRGLPPNISGVAADRLEPDVADQDQQRLDRVGLHPLSKTDHSWRTGGSL